MGGRCGFAEKVCLPAVSHARAGHAVWDAPKSLGGTPNPGAEAVLTPFLWFFTGLEARHTAGSKAIAPSNFYANHLKPPHNPWAESDARIKAAVDQAVSEAQAKWRNELCEMHRVMLRKRLAAALQLPTLSKSASRRTSTG